MPEGIEAIWKKISEYWVDLSKEQKMRVYVTVGVLLVAIIGIIIFTTKVQYLPLVLESDEIDRKSIIEYLDTQGVRYNLTEDGQIHIDAKRINEVKPKLIIDGVVTDDVQFADTWSMINLTSTNQDKKILWDEWKRKKLISQFKGFENIISVDVDYTEPEETFWGPVDETKQGSAYVKIERRGELTPEQVDGVIRIAAASLGINTQNITVVDQDLNVLNRNTMDKGIEIASRQEELRLQCEVQKENEIYDFFGAGYYEVEAFDTIKVSVNAVMDFDEESSKSTVYMDPSGSGEGFIDYKETLTESLVNGSSGAAPGADSNPGTSSYQFGDSSSSTYDKTQDLENRKFNQTETERVKSSGVFVSAQSSVAIALWYGRRVEDNANLDETYINQIKQSASNAIGVPFENISVNIFKLAPKIEPTVTVTDNLRSIVDQFGFLALMLILMIALVIAAIPRKEEEALSEDELEAAVSGPAFVVPENEETLPEIELEEQSEILKQIEKFVEQKPDAVAQLLRNWISDDWD